MYVSTKYCFSRIGGRRCIVPVLLEDFNDDQVSIISNLTFVNAVGSAAFDVSSRIAESVACSDLYATMFPGECTNVFSRFENGYSVELPLQRDNIRFNRPAKYRFRIDRDVLTLLTDSHMKVPDGLLKDVVKFVNKEAIMKSYYFLMKRNICCWVFFLLPPMLMLLGALVYFIVIVSTCTQERPDNETPHFDLDGVLGMLGVALGETYIAILIAMVCAVPKLCHREKRDIDLQVKIYSRFSRRCIKMTSLLSSADGKTVDQVKLRVVRYNFGKCQDYLENIIRGYNNITADENISPKEYIENLIEQYAIKMSKVMSKSYDDLPDASYNRHNVKKGKMCLCQKIEMYLRTEQQRQGTNATQ